MHLGFTQVSPSNLRLSTKGVTSKISQIDSANNNLQAKAGTLKLPGDSTVRASYQKVDSIRSNFQSKADSLQRAYQKPINQLNQTRESLQKKIDSLQTLELPAIGLTKKLDSVNSLSAQKIGEMKGEVEKLKSKATSGLNSLDLPPFVVVGK